MLIPPDEELQCPGISGAAWQRVVKRYLTPVNVSELTAVYPDLRHATASVWGQRWPRTWVSRKAQT